MKCKVINVAHDLLIVHVYTREMAAWDLKEVIWLMEEEERTAPKETSGEYDLVEE